MFSCIQYLAAFQEFGCFSPPSEKRNIAGASRGGDDGGTSQRERAIATLLAASLRWVLLVHAIVTSGGVSPCRAPAAPSAMPGDRDEHGPREKRAKHSRDGVVGNQGSFLPSLGDKSYERWLRETGTWWDDNLVEVRPPWRTYTRSDRVPVALRDGWGLMSRDTKIPKGTIICRVPKEAAFRGEDGSSSCENKDSQFHLAIRLLREQRKGAASAVWPKIATLPGGVPVCWAWTEEEQLWLIGTELQPIIESKLRRLASEFQDLVAPLNEGWTQAMYVDACATIISHANPWWGVSSVPFVDMGNHDDDPHVEFRQKGKHVVGTVLKTIPKFSEIYQSYGDLGSADLLYRYGFTREGADAHIPRAQDVVSIDATLLSSLTDGDVSGAQRRVQLLAQSNIIDQSPWDGLEDVLTLELACLVDNDHPPSGWRQTPTQPVHTGAGTAPTLPVATEGLRLSGMSELLVAALVMSAADDRWTLLLRTVEHAGEVLDLAAPRADRGDVHMLALFLSLQQLHQPGAATLDVAAAKLLERVTRAGISLSPPPAASSAVAGSGDGDEESEESDGEDERKELDWLLLVGEMGEHAPWLRGTNTVQAARCVVERRLLRLQHSQPELSGVSPQACAAAGVVGATSKGQRLRMAQRIRQLECAVLNAALAALARLAAL